MAKPKIQAPENKTLGIEQGARAATLAERINDAIMPEIDRLNAAKQDWEGGAFEVMAKLIATLTKAEQDALPDPNSDTGNNPAKYLKPITRIDNKGRSKTEWKEHYYYKDLTLDMPGIVAKKKLKDQIERSLGADDKVNKSDIPDAVLSWKADYRRAQITKLTNEINNAVKKITDAFELWFQIKNFNAKLDHVQVSPVYAVMPDGSEMDGLEGRPFKVEATTNPILMQTTVKSRILHDVEALSISSFLKVDIDKASELGGTFEAVKTVLKRVKKDVEEANGGTGNVQDQSRPQAVKTPDTANARAMDLYVFADEAIKAKDKAAWQALKKSLNAADSDAEFMAWRGLLHYAKLLVGSPADDKRFADLTKDMEATDKLADAA